MPKRYFLELFSILLLTTYMVVLPGCTTTDESDDTGYQLIQLDVIVGEGVTGTPETGTYTYDNEEVVFYNYSLEPSYSNLVVTFDNEEVEPSGTVTISQTHTLKASATPIYNVSGNWTMDEQYDDGSFFNVALVFTGTTQEGTVTDSQGGSGTYVLNDDNSLDFTLNYPDITYEYEGIFDDANNMNGDCKRIISGETIYGTWEATRKEESAARKSSGPKYSKNQ